jgi:alkylation response protein AidB-like acyl-CoA dehydrogenase
MRFADEENVMPSRSLLPADLAVFAAEFREWLCVQQPALRDLLAGEHDFDRRVAQARRLRSLLYAEGWGRYGWAETVGGLGGSILHRAVMYEELVRSGWHGPTVFEHLEIVAPTVVRYADPEFAATAMPAFLDGTRAWAQAFSEPEAGSDLASLRTRADEDGDVFIVNGTKIWTSWAKWAHTALVLVRTGRREDRHRGLTMLAIDLDRPGVTVRPIRQANGSDELAEVAFDEVRVPRNRLIGEIGGGWAVAFHLLARERGILSWFRHCHFRQRLAEAAMSSTPMHDQTFGELAVRLAGLRSASVDLVRAEAAGLELGPSAAYNKLLMTRYEQGLYDVLRDLHGARITAPSSDTNDVLLQQDYLFSRIVTIYGGSQQMQLTTIANHILGLVR